MKAESWRRPGHYPRSKTTGTCGRRPRAHTLGSRSKWLSPLSHKPLPPVPPLCAPSRVSVPTIKPTIETFPKPAIYLLPIYRSAVIKKSMWPGLASLSRGENELSPVVLSPPGGRRRGRTCERRVPRGPHPRTSSLSARFPVGRVPSGGEGRAPAACFPLPLSRFSRSRGGGSGCQRAAPRLLLLLGGLNGGFVTRDR